MFRSSNHPWSVRKTSTRSQVLLALVLSMTCPLLQQRQFAMETKLTDPLGQQLQVTGVVPKQAGQ